MNISVLLVKALEKLSPVKNWKIENVPNKLVSLAKNILGQNNESVNLHLLVACKKIQERDQLKRDLLNLQGEFGGNRKSRARWVENSLLHISSISTGQSQKWPQYKD